MLPTLNWFNVHYNSFYWAFKTSRKGMQIKLCEEEINAFFHS